MRNILQDPSRSLRQFGIDHRGNIAILSAILLPVFIGMVGLGSEVGYWQLTQRKLQQAADMAAYGAGIRKRSGDEEATYKLRAEDIAKESGWNNSLGSITVLSPPTSGAYSGNKDAVEVLLTEVHQPLFSGVMRTDPITIHSRSVVLLQNTGKACVLALNTSASKALKVGGTADVEFINCDMTSNSLATDSFDQAGSSTVSTGCVYTVGEAEYTSGLTLTSCTDPVENSPYTPDPYKYVKEPAVVGPCENKNVGKNSGKTTVKPDYDHPDGMGKLKSMRFCNGLQVKGQVHFDPGLYIIENGDFSANAGAQITGDDVVFFITNGASVKFNGGADFELRARTEEPFSGLLFFGDRDETASQSVNGGAGALFQGAIYFAGADVQYNGGAGVADGCTQIIADTIELIGNADIEAECDGKGTKPILVGQAVTYVE
jgi:Putative Flp pilus-assembly TadE/G-like